MACDHRPSSSLVIDANVLSLLVGYHYCIGARIKPLDRVNILVEIRGRDHNRDDNLPPERFDDLWQLFGNAQHRTVTQHVIAETLNCKRGWLQRRKRDARESAISLMEEFGVDEQPCHFRDLIVSPAYLKMFLELGPTDAGLLYVAERIKATLISEDGPARQFASARNVQAYSLREIPALAQRQ